MSSVNERAAREVGVPMSAQRTRTLSERLTDLAIAVTFCEAKLANAPSLDEIALAISEIANELDQFDLAEHEGQFPTPRQALALGRFLNQAMRDDRFEVAPRDAYATVSRSRIGVGGISERYLGVRFADGYEGGIDREGHVST